MVLCAGQFRAQGIPGDPHDQDREQQRGRDHPDVLQNPAHELRVAEQRAEDLEAAVSFLRSMVGDVDVPDMGHQIRAMIEQRAADAIADAMEVVEVSDRDLTDVVVAADHAEFTWRGRPVHVALGGDVNVTNAHLALTIAAVLGVDEDAAAGSLASFHGWLLSTYPFASRTIVIAASIPSCRR